MLYSDPDPVDHLLFDSRRTLAEPAACAHPSSRSPTSTASSTALWKLTDPALIQQVLDAMDDKWLLIADGHHRYETSTTYMHERAAELGLDPNAKPVDATVAPGKALPHQPSPSRP